MANISYCEINLTASNLFDLKSAYDSIDSQTNDLGFSEINTLTVDPDKLTLSISGTGRWQVNPEPCSELVSKYYLSGTFMDSEPGANLFELITYKDGCIESELTSDYMSAEHFKYIPDSYSWLMWYQGIFKDDDWQEQHSDVVDFLVNICGYSIAELEKHANEL